MFYYFYSKAPKQKASKKMFSAAGEMSLKWNDKNMWHGVGSTLKVSSHILIVRI